MSRNLIRLSWRVATYKDLTPSAALSGSLGPSCCLGVLDVSVFDDESNLVDVWDLCSKDIMVDRCSCRGCIRMLSAHSNLIEDEDRIFPERSLKL
jgi:hypothetical protein